MKTSRIESYYYYFFSAMVFRVNLALSLYYYLLLAVGYKAGRSGT